MITHRKRKILSCYNFLNFLLFFLKVILKLGCDQVSSLQRKKDKKIDSLFCLGIFLQW